MLILIRSKAIIIRYVKYKSKAIAHMYSMEIDMVSVRYNRGLSYMKAYLDSLESIRPPLWNTDFEEWIYGIYARSNKEE